MKRAFTREVSPQLAKCELTHLSRVLIDAATASVQHARYEEALADGGFTVVRLPPLPDFPDAVFVEDTALLLGAHAIITRPGASSRLNEAQSTASALAGRFVLHSVDRGHLDGGDVLRIGTRLYVGLSSRTDRQGIAALQELVGPIGFEVIAAELKDCLHLKTGASFAGADPAGRQVLLYDAASVDARQFAGIEAFATDPLERNAANCLRAGDRLITAAGNPKTADKLRARGFDVVEIDISELQKAEAGVSCMSLIDEQT